MQFESFQPSKSRTISKPENGKERVPVAPRAKNWMQALSGVELSTNSGTDAGHHDGAHYSTRTERIVLSEAELRRFRTAAFRELVVESNFLSPQGLRMPSRSEAPNRLPVQWSFAPVVSSSGSVAANQATASAGEPDLVWSSASSVDPLKRSLTMWQDSLFHSVDSLLTGKISEFFVLGTSVQEPEAMEGMFAPTCAFFRTDSSQCKVLLLNCGQYAVKRLQQLGAQCERLLDGSQPKVSAATSTAGVLQLLRGSNHIVVKEDLGVRAAAQFIAEEVFSFAERGTPCKSIPPLLSCSELLHSHPDPGQWTIVSAGGESTEKDSSDGRLGGWLPSLLKTRGRECISPTEPSVETESARQLKAKLSSCVTIQQVADWVARWMEAGRRSPPSSSTSRSSSASASVIDPNASALSFYDERAMRQVRRRLNLAHAVEKAPVVVSRSTSGTFRALEITSLMKRSLSSSSTRILNPMLIVTGRQATRSAEQQQDEQQQDSDGDASGDGEADDERWFRVSCREFPGKAGSYLFSAHAGGREGTGGMHSTMDVVREIRWTSRSPQTVEVVLDRVPLPAKVRAELWDVREKAKSAIDGEGALELAPVKPYSAHVESVW